MFWKPAQLMVNPPKSSLLVKVHFTLHSATPKKSKLATPLFENLVLLINDQRNMTNVLSR